MRQLVEDVEDGWYAGLLSRWCRLIPAVCGGQTVGGRVVAWALHRNDVAITHQSATDPHELVIVPINICIDPWH